MRKVTDLKGFTLIEILIVIGLIAILAAVTIIALNPTASFQDARNSERQTEMAQIHTAINRYIVDGGSVTGLPACTGTAPNITAVPFPTATALSTALIPNYLAAHPFDPGNGGATNYYNICQSGTAITLVAPNTDGTRVYITR